MEACEHKNKIIRDNLSKSWRKYRFIFEEEYYPKN